MPVFLEDNKKFMIQSFNTLVLGPNHRKILNKTCNYQLLATIIKTLR